MANHCMTYVDIAGPRGGLDAVLDAIRSIRPETAPKGRTEYPDGDFHTELLWDAAGIPAGARTGGISAVVSSVNVMDGGICLAVDSKWRPQLAPIRDLVQALAPGCAIDAYACEPMMDLYLSTRPNKAFLLFQGDAEGEKADAIKCWESVRDLDACLADVYGLLGAAAPKDGAAALEAFGAEYPVEIHAMRQAPLDEFCD